jgi:hypothetical protein
MEAIDPAVARRAGDVAEAARSGSAWIEAHAERLQLDSATLKPAFKRFARRAQRLRAAAERPTAVAVFGASQAGKSYLVSGLARAPGRELVVVYGRDRMSFLREMNPQGDKESTGLVTRFTVRPPPATGVEQVPLRLLSQTDVVKILANTFCEDFRQENMTPPDPAAVGKLFEGLAPVAGGAPQAALAGDDIEELREYFDLHLGGNPWLQALGPLYWRRAIELIPRLPPERRAEAYAPLWGGLATFTRVADQLIRELGRLGFAESVFCGTDALRPRENGILNAETLFGLGDPRARRVRVAGAAATSEIPVPVLAALTAELTFPVAEKPWEFMQHTDLLDFPGARSREEIPESVLKQGLDGFLATPSNLGRVFLRGKVAYLWQRYNTEQEIAAMLLCVGPSNQDVPSLARMIHGWVVQTIGPTPEARARQRNSLFLVLTKFDTEFVEKAGEDIHSGERWNSRIEASLLNPFAFVYDWPKQWTPGRPFDNAQWLRSTAVAFDRVFDYSGVVGADGTEETLAARAAGFLAPREAAYLGAEKVRLHIASPERAWDEALRPNDGGISYLAERLAPVCDPSLKAGQIVARVDELAGDLERLLRPHYRTGNAALEMARAQATMRQVLRDLVACASAQMFGALLRALELSPEQIAGLYWRLQTDDDVMAETRVAPVGQVPSHGDYADGIGDLLPELAEAAAPRTAPRDRFERLADAALQEWHRSMRLFAEDTEMVLQPLFRIGREQALALVGEIERAARRLGLRERAASALRARANFIANNPLAAQKQMIIVEREVNRFVQYLGFDAVPLSERPTAPDRTLPEGKRPIFAPRPARSGLPNLGAQPAAYDAAFHIDWMRALARTFESNVEGGAPDDVLANDSLGRILARLETRGA